MEHVRLARRGRNDVAGLQSRDGRSGALRQPAADARRRSARHRNTGRASLAHRGAGPRRRLSGPDQGTGVRVSPRNTIATATRVLTQLRRDPRTIALLLVVPAALVALIKFVFDGNPGAFDRIGGPLVGLFPFITMFLVTSITMLRERTTGTLERLMTMPLAKLDILLGYGLAFVFPQLLLCGLFVARDQMAEALEAVSYALPLTYAYDALERVTTDGSLGARGTADVVVICGAIVLALALGAATLRRRTA